MHASMNKVKLGKGWIIFIHLVEHISSPSMFVIHESILLIQECNLQQIATQAGHIVYHLLFDMYPLSVS